MAASLMDKNTRCAQRMILACRVVQSVRHSPSRRMALTGIATYLVAIYLIPLGLPAFGAVVRDFAADLATYNAPARIMIWLAGGT
jgi:hypothetical protein